MEEKILEQCCECLHAKWKGKCCMKCEELDNPKTTKRPIEVIYLNDVPSLIIQTEKKPVDIDIDVKTDIMIKDQNITEKDKPILGEPFYEYCVVCNKSNKRSWATCSSKCAKLLKRGTFVNR